MSEVDPLIELDTDLAFDIAQEEISRYIATAYATVTAGLPDTPAETANQMRWLHLAEPWLPAGAITKRLREAGLLA